MRKLAIGLWAAQVLAATIAFVAALVNVESILGTGPALSITGLVLAAVTRRLNAWSSIVFGLSGPPVCALGATLIAVGHWGPHQAELPIAILLDAYVLLAILLAAVSLRAILRWQFITPTELERAWQYSMRTLLLWMTAVCVLAAVARYVVRNLSVGPIRGEGYMFMSFALAAIVLSGAILWRFLAKRRKQGKSEQGTQA